MFLELISRLARSLNKKSAKYLLSEVYEFDNMYKVKKSSKNEVYLVPTNAYKSKIERAIKQWVERLEYVEVLENPNVNFCKLAVYCQTDRDLQLVFLILKEISEALYIELGINVTRVYIGGIKVIIMNKSSFDDLYTNWQLDYQLALRGL